MKQEEMTTDEIMETLAWIVDRRRYRISCGIRDGVANAEECKIESSLLAELSRREGQRRE